jgi:CBS domain-containing protein
MRPSPKPISPDRSARDAALRMLDQRVPALPVVEPTAGGPRLIGVITERDLLREAYER